MTGLNAEVVFPVLGNRLSVSGDFGYLPISYEESLTTFKYISAGANLYLLKKAKGFYIGADYGLMPVAVKPASSTITYSTNFSFFNSKAGFKLGEKMYFNIELGYSLIFYNLDSANELLDEAYGIQIKPDLNYLQLLNGKIGIGYSF